MKKLRIVGPVDAIEHQPQQAALELGPAPSRQRSANTYVSVAKKLGFSPNTETTNGTQAAKDAVLEPLPTFGFGARTVSVRVMRTPLTNPIIKNEAVQSPTKAIVARFFEVELIIVLLLYLSRYVDCRKRALMT